MTAPEYVGFRDLLARWVYTRQGVYLVMRWPDFPAPAFEIDGGKTKVWRLVDVESFEKRHPELLTEAAKEFKRKGYYLTMMRDPKGLQRTPEALARRAAREAARQAEWSADIDGDD